MSQNYSESITDVPGARMEFISVNSDEPFMQVIASGVGSEAGQSVTFSFTQQGFALLLACASRSFSYNVNT